MDVPRWVLLKKKQKHSQSFPFQMLCVSHRLKMSEHSRNEMTRHRFTKKKYISRAQEKKIASEITFYFSKWLITIKSEPQKKREIEKEIERENIKINKLTSQRRERVKRVRWRVVKLFHVSFYVVLLFGSSAHSRLSTLKHNSYATEQLQPLTTTRKKATKYAGFVVWIEQVFHLSFSHSLRLVRDRLDIITPHTTVCVSMDDQRPEKKKIVVVAAFEAWIHTEHCRMISKTWYIGSQMYFRLRRRRRWWRQSSPIDTVASWRWEGNERLRNEKKNNWAKKTQRATKWNQSTMAAVAVATHGKQSVSNMKWMISRA